MKSGSHRLDAQKSVLFFSACSVCMHATKYSKVNFCDWSSACMGPVVCVTCIMYLALIQNNFTQKFPMMPLLKLRKWLRSTEKWPPKLIIEMPLKQLLLLNQGLKFKMNSHNVPHNAL